MKKNILNLIFIAFLMMMLPLATQSQNPPPPPGDPSGGGGNPPVGGGAPVDEGFILLVALASAYGYRTYKMSDNR